MESIKYGLSEEHYNILKNMPDYATMRKHFIKNYCSDSILYGYGLYGVGNIGEENGKYYIEITIGSSCD